MCYEPKGRKRCILNNQSYSQCMVHVTYLKYNLCVNSHTFYKSIAPSMLMVPFITYILYSLNLTAFIAAEVDIIFIA